MIKIKDIFKRTTKVKTRRAVFYVLLAVLIGGSLGCFGIEYYYDHVEVGKTAECYQMDVKDPSQPKAIIYQPDKSIELFIKKGVCKDLLAEAKPVYWTDLHPKLHVVACLGIFVLAIVFIIVALCVLAFLVMGPIVAVWRWAFDDRFEYDSLWETFKYTMKNG